MCFFQEYFYILLEFSNLTLKQMLHCFVCFVCFISVVFLFQKNPVKVWCQYESIQSASGNRTEVYL